MLTPLPLIRYSAEPAFDQINDASFDFHPKRMTITPSWSDSQNWNDEALDALSGDIAHLTLQRGTLDTTVIATVMRLDKLTTLELVNVTIPPEMETLFHCTLMARKIERIYYTGLYAPKWIDPTLEKIPSTLYVKTGSYFRNEWIGASHLHRLDAREALTLACINQMSLVSGDPLLDTLICKSENCDGGSAKALTHLRVRHLILTGPHFGDNTALGLEWNTRIESITLVDVPLTRDWVRQLLRMSRLASLKLVRPRSVRTAVEATAQFASPIDHDFVSGLSSIDQNKISFSDYA
ncbi:hypothetical protein [Robbsia sp. KACC 23696]|uniref:hypothetical protein n=1 Tax=Robbsia sp. KACC 23696 TaxID=3149231 RepID=UPI00325B7605